MLVLAAALPARSATVALLVGVGQYQAFAGQPHGNLEGPAHDLAAFKDLLLEQWRLPPGAVRVLQDREATKARILAEIDALAARSRPGDEVLIYFSGHGTGALDAGANLPLPHGSGAWVPYDWPGGGADVAAQVAGLIVGRRDLRPRLAKLEAAGRKLFVVADACYSGSAVRSPQSGKPLASRYLPLPSAALLDSLAKAGGNAAPGPAPGIEPYPYHATVYLAAAAEGEQARDISRGDLAAFPTVDGRPHGAMTDALLRVLSGALDADVNRDGQIDFREIHGAVAAFVATRAYGHTPQLLPAVADDQAGLALSSLSPLRQMPRPNLPAGGGGERLRVAGQGLPSEIQAGLRPMPDIEWVAAAAAPDLLLRAQRGALYLLTPAGDVLQAIPMQHADSLRQRLAQLGWAHRLRGLAERGRRGLLPFDFNPAAFGGNFTAGQRFNLAMRPEHPALLVVIDIDADGYVTVLYPARPEEVRQVPAGQARFVPGEGPEDLIEARPPFGTDLLFAFAFERPPANIARWTGLERVPADDPRLAKMLDDVKAAAGAYSFGYAELRVLGKP